MQSQFSHARPTEGLYRPTVPHTYGGPKVSIGGWSERDVALYVVVQHMKTQNPVVRELMGKERLPIGLPWDARDLMRSELSDVLTVRNADAPSENGARLN